MGLSNLLRKEWAWLAPPVRLASTHSWNELVDWLAISWATDLARVLASWIIAGMEWYGMVFGRWVLIAHSMVSARHRLGGRASHGMDLNWLSPWVHMEW